MRQRGRGLRCRPGDPDNAGALRDRGLALGTLGRFDEAIRDYEQSLRLEPDNPDAFTARGLAYNGQQRYDLAIQEFTRAIGLDAGSAQTLYHRGMTYGFLGSYDQAIDDFNTALAFQPDHGEALCFARFESGEYEEALRDFDKLIELMPGQSDAYYGRACAYAFMNQPLQAIDDFERSIRLDPEHAHSLLNRQQTVGPKPKPR